MPSFIAGNIIVFSSLISLSDPKDSSSVKDSWGILDLSASSEK